MAEPFDNGDLLDPDQGYKFYQTFIDLCSLKDPRFNESTLDQMFSSSDQDEFKFQDQQDSRSQDQDEFKFQDQQDSRSQDQDEFKFQDQDKFKFLDQDEFKFQDQDESKFQDLDESQDQQDSRSQDQDQDEFKFQDQDKFKFLDQDEFKFQDQQDQQDSRSLDQDQQDSRSLDQDQQDSRSPDQDESQDQQDSRSLDQDKFEIQDQDEFKFQDQQDSRFQDQQDSRSSGIDDKLDLLVDDSDEVLHEFMISRQLESNSEDKTEVQVAEMTRQDKVSLMKSLDFRKFLLKQIGRKFELVEIMAQTLSRGVIKPQRLLVDDPDYYVAIDLMTNTYYLCYRTLMMVDIDYYKEGCVSRSFDDLIKIFEEYCGQNPELLFRIYKSRGGVHGFLVSSSSDYRDGAAITRMLDLDCDFYYSIYSYIRGWSVRLNRKKKDVSVELYEYVGTVGTGVEDEHLGKLTDLHINLLSVFAGVGFSTMAGV
jgi:hypothetical protein